MANQSCQACKQLIEVAYYNWVGPPFSVRSNRMICFYCLSAMRAKTTKVHTSDVELVGTFDGDVHTLSEMIADGFDKERSGRSIRVIGKCLGLSPYRVKQKLAK